MGVETPAVLLVEPWLEGLRQVRALNLKLRRVNGVRQADPEEPDFPEQERYRRCRCGDIGQSFLDGGELIAGKPVEQGEVGRHTVQARGEIGPPLAAEPVEGRTVEGERNDQRVEHAAAMA